MTKTIIILSAAFLLLSSCGDSKKKTSTDNNGPSSEVSGPTVNESDGTTGKFSVDGTSFSGKSSTQYFGDKTTGQFSVLCEQSEPYALLQAVFENEAATKGDFKPSESFTTLEPGHAHIALSGTAIGAKEFVTKSNSGGSISVSGNKLTIKDLELFDQDKNKKVVSAEIAF